MIMRTQRIAFSVLVAAAAACELGGSVETTSPRFYADDPIARSPESQDASRGGRSDIGALYETGINILHHPGYQPSGVRAKDVNTIDEVPDSSWFTNRIGTKPLELDDIVRGPNVSAPTHPTRWARVHHRN